MITCNRTMMCCCMLVLYFACSNAFFLHWGSSSVESSQPQTQQYTPTYQRRHLQTPYAANAVPVAAPDQQEGIPVQIPAVPVQVPLQATFASSPNIHNVQLVPCLCPVAEDYGYEEYNRKPETIYVNPVKNQYVTTSQQQQQVGSP